MRSCCIWLVDSVKSTTMHGLENPKLKKKFSSFFSFITGLSRKNADRVRRSELYTAALLYFDISEVCIFLLIVVFVC
jgi:hypothetical protein